MYQLVSIILPVYNQADHIGTIVRAHLSKLDSLPMRYELLLVVNGCRDSSLEVCRSLAEEFPTVRVVFSEKGGWGLAVKKGITEAQGDLICYTNSARTSPEDLILHLCYGMANPGIVIKANRKIRENPIRRAGSLLYNIECRHLFDLTCWDLNGTPKVFPRACGNLLKLQSDDDLIDAEFNYVCRKNDYPMVEVPIASTMRHGGISTTTLSSALRLYLGAYKLSKQLKKESA